MDARLLAAVTINEYEGRLRDDMRAVPYSQWIINIHLAKFRHLQHEFDRVGAKGLELQAREAHQTVALALTEVKRGERMGPIPAAPSRCALNPKF